MTFGTLVRFRLRALARRIGLGRPGGAVALAAWLVAGAGVLLGLGFLGAHLAEVDAGTVTPIPWAEARRRILAAANGRRETP